MAKTIRAAVTQDILRKAERFFNGSDSQRCIELLQNARRAGATHVTITCDKVDDPAPYRITVSDNGRGIDAFETLLSMGGSGWRGELAESEDPAGVGFFCLKPMPVTVTSKGQRIRIYGDRWIGAPIPVEDAPSLPGTRVEFTSPSGWKDEMVEALSIFTGMTVTCNGHVTQPIPFDGALAKHLPELGVRLSIARNPGQQHLSRAAHWTAEDQALRYQPRDLFINFHGQVLRADYSAFAGQPAICANLTGEPTGLRMVLPGRTALHQNAGLKQLLHEVVRFAFEYVKSLPSHTLAYSEWLKAREYGVELPEARPMFSTGLPVGENGLDALDVPESTTQAITSRLYRVEDDDHHANAYLAARKLLAKDPETRFVPVDIPSAYMGYTWAKNLPHVTDAKLHVRHGRFVGEHALRGSCNSGNDVIMVEALEAEIHTSDGEVFRQALPCAKQRYKVLICPDVLDHFETDELFNLSDSYCSDDAKDYDDQCDEFSEMLSGLIDDATDYPDALRRRVAAAVRSALACNRLAPEWASVTVDEKYDAVTVVAQDGRSHKLVGSCQKSS